MHRIVTQRIARQRLVSTRHAFPILRQFSAVASIESHGSLSGWLTLMGAAAAVATVHQTWTTSQCEQVPTPPVEGEGDEEEDREDPYANIPEEDEETDCSMCKTFRQGPCRPYWRKLERCFKDHEGEENGAVKCMRYFKPHQQCLMGYSNLYQLVSLEMKQELVHDLELSISEEERRKWNPKIDWSTYLEFTKETGLSYKETVQSRDAATKELLPLWKRLPDNKEPVLLTLTSHLPKFTPETGMILKVAYAVDQDGYVLGLTYNKMYGELLEKSKSKNVNAEAVKDEKLEEAQDNPDDQFEFDFFVLPGETKSIRICGLYSENPFDADPSKDILDALLFKSKSFSLKKIAKSSL